jgi:hypothetical protein
MKYDEKEVDKLYRENLSAAQNLLGCSCSVLEGSCGVELRQVIDIEPNSANLAPS